MNMNQKIIGLVTTLTLVGSLASCSSASTPESQQPKPATSAENTTQPDTMKGEGDAMQQGDTMKEDGDAMQQDDTMKEDGDAMQQDDTMKEDGDAMQQGDTMKK